jgi:predicted nucleic acid-binding protein
MEDNTVMFIDSNYWIYLFDKTTIEHPHVKAHFEKLYGEAVLAVNVVILVEVMHYLVKHLGSVLSKEKWELFRSMDMLVGTLDLNSIDSVYAVMSKHAHTGIGGRDAAVLQFMEENHIRVICTHDGAFTKIQNITVIDPIPKSPGCEDVSK